MTDRVADPLVSRVAGQLADRVVTEAAARLRARGDRMTGPRRAVLGALAAEQRHQSAEDVIASVGRLDPSVHRASVYRALETLSELGVVQHVHAGHGLTTYHLMPAPGPHPHAQCQVCGTVYDLPDDLLDAVAAQLAGQTGFVLDTGHVALSGTCADCAASG